LFSGRLFASRTILTLLTSGYTTDTERVALGGSDCRELRN
jgi:hypothetical protein